MSAWGVCVSCVPSPVSTLLLITRPGSMGWWVLLLLGAQVVPAHLHISHLHNITPHFATELTTVRESKHVQILRLFAQAISNSNLRPEQVVAEHGGDEFKTWPVRPGRWVEESHVTFTPPLKHKMSYFHFCNVRFQGGKPKSLNFSSPRDDALPPLLLLPCLQGEIWPKPAEQRSVEEFLVLRSSNFRFQVFLKL